MTSQPPPPPRPPQPAPSDAAAPAATIVIVQEEKKKIIVPFVSPQIASYFIAGGVAGAASRTVVSPLERLKIIQYVPI